jgi:signal transduction histidine kinase
MSFRISARTVLALGAELISSDDVAIYELVKNAIDAKSKTGVEIHFHITFSHSAFSETLEELESGDAVSVDELKERLLGRVEPTSEPELLERLKEKIESCKTYEAFRANLSSIYADTNWIEIRDTGIGMSGDDIVDKYLVIGTPTRKKDIDKAEADFSKKSQNGKAALPTVPFLGEKGIGRLSVMRLGWILHLESASEKDKTLNELEIDWRQFENLDLYLEDVKIKPTRNGPKPNPSWSGTIIKISGLSGNWSAPRIRDVAISEFAKISDPFSIGRRRFRIAVFFNGERIEIPRMDREILKAAHATVRASYVVKGGSPTLDVHMMFKGPQREEDKHLRFEDLDVSTLMDDAEQEIPSHAQRSVGPFEFEAYWYNRQRLKALDSIGDLNTVRTLQKHWAGIMLFRDGYRVLPYGEEKDDWLGLDRRAFASGGYKLNKLQFIGRVEISRLANPKLIDQTNREGLKENSEKYVLVEILKFVTQNLLRHFMDDVERSQRHVEVDVQQIDERISTLEKRATDAIRRLKHRHSDSSLQLEDLHAIFEQMKEYFNQARALAEQAEDERARLIQLAGIGLMLEVVAHELARSTETAMKSLANAHSQDLPEGIAATLKVLRTEMQTMNKRLRVLDPLSISGRQQRETFDLVALVRETFEGRHRQFERHNIRTQVSVRGGANVIVSGVKGMFVQIIENLTANSVFWLRKQSQENRTFEAQIQVVLDSKSRRLIFRDNGPGISEALKEDIFKPFFSTKDRRRRQGLGLYIARECAQYNEARLVLSDEHTEHETRLNTFILELPER